MVLMSAHGLVLVCLWSGIITGGLKTKINDTPDDTQKRYFPNY